VHVNMWPECPWVSRWCLPSRAFHLACRRMNLDPGCWKDAAYHRFKLVYVLSTLARLVNVTLGLRCTSQAWVVVTPHDKKLLTGFCVSTAFSNPNELPKAARRKPFLTPGPPFLCISAISFANTPACTVHYTLTLSYIAAQASILPYFTTL
jgi:hypothetical protein